MKTVLQHIEKAANPKDIRSYLREPYFDGKRLLASNGHILAVVRTEKNEVAGYTDTRGHVPTEILKAARKKGSDVILNGKAEAPLAGLSLDRPDLGDWMKPSACASVIRKARRNTIKVGINAKLLLDLARAINEQTGKYDENVTLYINAEDSEKSAIFVRAGKGGKGYGAIMPVRL